MGFGFSIQSFHSSMSKKYVIFINVSFLMVVCLYFLNSRLISSEFSVHNSDFSGLNSNSDNSCKELKQLDGYESKCLYLKSTNSCSSEGYIDYLSLLYCNFARFPILGHFLLLLWLLVLFYVLGNTASDYFCSSLENLSRVLKLSPTIAGVTLLSLGNGAPDVFASLVSFMGNGTSDIGLNTVLGGASFVTCVVVGVISISLHRKHVQVDKSAFVRDVCFFILVLTSLVWILVIGKISLLGAFAFLSMYVVYVGFVYFYDKGVVVVKGIEGNDLMVPILNEVEKEELSSIEEGGDSLVRVDDDDDEKCCHCFQLSNTCVNLLYVLELPLSLPRKLTIPVINEKQWSKPMAVFSVTLSPILLSTLWISQDGHAELATKLTVYTIGVLLGVVLGVLAYMTTEKPSPPKKYTFIWLAGGFLMSMVWTYITAQELVGLLVSLGHINGISPSILGLTVLAWGNSIGDLITNMSIALKGGHDQGAQIAISGCYAGPIFNTLFGLGLSLVGSCWYEYPSSVLISRDPYLLETLGFLVAGLIWALVVLPKRGMRLDGVLGAGLLVIYLVSLCLRLIQTLGYFQIDNLFT